MVLSDANNNAIKKMKLLGRIKMQISDMSETKKRFIGLLMIVLIVGIILIYLDL